MLCQEEDPSLSDIRSKLQQRWAHFPSSSWVFSSQHRAVVVRNMSQYIWLYGGFRRLICPRASAICLDVLLLSMGRVVKHNRLVQTGETEMTPSLALRDERLKIIISDNVGVFRPK